MFREGDEAVAEGAFVRLSYAQAALDYLSGSYPVPFEEAARLAALQAGAEGCVGGGVGGGGGEEAGGEERGKRSSEDEEIAACVAFLAREDAGFVTGATLTVNGGQYMSS